MKYLGKTYSKTDTMAIVKSTFTPKLGEKVVDSKNKDVGIVKGILGPVKTPYISIKLLKNLSGEDFYLR